jgi:hypothetical protein
MKTNKIIIIFVCIMLVFFTLGMTEVLHMSTTKMDEENINDRLIGVFITTEHLDLFDAEGYFNNNPEKIRSGGEISENVSNMYQGKLYATLVEKPLTNVDTGEIQMPHKYIFEGMEGISYYYALYTDDAGTYHGSSSDNAISDGKIAISSTDEGDSASLEGTIYASTTGGANSFYYNPVYQTGNGEVYTTSGQGMSFGGESTEGMSGSQAFTEETSTTSGNETKTIRSYINVTISFMDEPERVRLIQLDSESKVLSQEEYMPGKLPDRLTVDAGTEYIIVETESNGTNPNGNITRELYQPDDESLFAFYCREDGICVKQDCNITWES